MAAVTLATEKLLKLKKRIRCICGGTSASKTYSILMILIDYAQSNNNKKIDVISESIPHLDDGAIKDFKEIMVDRDYWEDSRWNSTTRIYTFDTKTVIKFKSVDKLGKSRGPRRDILFVNEANNIEYDIVDQLMVRTKEVIWLDWNPSHEFWYYTEIKDNRDHDFLTLTYKDCLDVLDKRIVDDIESHKSNKNWWKVYGLGLLGELEGKIYKDGKIIDEIPHEARLERYGLNFGYSNHALGLIALYYYNGGYIVDEIAYGRGINNQEIASILKNLDKALVVADSAEPKSIDEIKSYRIQIIGVKKQSSGGLKSVVGSAKSFVNWSINAVQQEKISVTKRSVNVIREYRNYMWQKDRDGKILNVPEEPFHYSMDAVRYAICSLAPVINKKELNDAAYQRLKARWGNDKKVNPAR
jgi:phage terminase large subunit